MARAQPTRLLGTPELVALLAALMSLMAFSTDSILPAMTELAQSLTPDDKSRTQYIVSLFLLGSGVGMMIFGPMSDSFGRRKALMAGIGLYIAASAAAAFANSLEVLLVLRFFMGVGAAATRTVSQAVTRDLFSGAQQARISSLIFMAFVIVPAMAPLVGQQIIWAVGWRGLFGTYMLFGTLILTWFLVRQPETLAPEHRRAFRLKPILAAIVEVLRVPVSRRYVVVQMLLYGQFIAYLSSAEQLWVDAMDVGERFPLFFAGVSILAAGAGFLNSRLVVRVGMRRMLLYAFGSQTVFALIAFTIFASGVLDGAPDWVGVMVFALWSVSLFFINGLTLGNVIALAMEPLGHLAGTAAAVIGAVGMVAAMVIAAPLGQAFDGTPRPIMLGAAICSALAVTLVATDMGRKRR